MNFISFLMKKYLFHDILIIVLWGSIMRKDLFGYAKQDIERETDFDYDNND